MVESLTEGQLVVAWTETTLNGVAGAPKVSNPSLRHLASHARIAIQIRRFSTLVPEMAHRTRNKIAQSVAAR
jgi:hypothetical protein